MARQNGSLSVTADGEFLAVVADRNVVQIVKLPGGRAIRRITQPPATRINELVLDKSGHHLAGITEDGHVQVWKLAPWQEWMARHWIGKMKTRKCFVPVSFAVTP
jgi:hypothetical protein